MPLQPIKASDLYKDDGAILKAIEQLVKLTKSHQDSLGKIQSQTKGLLTETSKLNVSNKDQAEQLKRNAGQLDQLAQAQLRYKKSISDSGVEMARMRELQNRQNQLNKLEIQLANSKAGSYNALSAQYSINKIRLNAMSEQQRKATVTGQALEKETRKIYEEMNRLQVATGKHQLQVGNYALAQQQVGKGLDIVKTGLMRVAGVMGIGIGAYKAFQAVLFSTRSGMNAFKDVVAGTKAGLDFLARSIATMNLKDLAKGFSDAWQEAERYNAALRSVVAQQRALDISKAEIETQILDLKIIARNRQLDVKERKEAVDQIIALEQQKLEATQKVTKSALDNELTHLSQITKLRQEDIISLVRNTDEMKAKLSESGLLQEKLNSLITTTTTQVGDALIRNTDMEAYNAAVANLSEEEKYLLSIRTGSNLLLGEMRDKVKELMVADVNAVNERKSAELSLARLKNQLFNELMNDQEQETKKEQKEDQEAIKTAQAVAQNKVDIMDEGMNKELEKLRLSFEQKEKEWKEAGESTVELEKWYAKQREAIYLNHAKEMVRKKQEQENQIKEIAAQQYETDLASFEELQKLEQAKFDLTAHTETEKTRFTLEQEKKRLEFIKQNAQGMSEIQLATLDALIAGINSKLAGLAEQTQGKDIWSMLGMNVTEEQKQGMVELFNQLTATINTVTQALVDQANQAVSAADAKVQSAEQALAKEQEYADKGYYSNVARKKKELEEAKRQQASAIKDQQKAAKQQQAINAALQAVNLITASTKIISTYAAMPYIWIPLLALMWGTYAWSLSKAKGATAAGGISMGEGGTVELDGGSHASRRNEVNLGTSNGKPVKAEGGEKMSIFSRKASAKYGNRINNLVDRINKGQTSPTTIDQIIKAIDTGKFESWVMGTNLDITNGEDQAQNRELQEISSDVKRIREAGEKKEYRDSRGRRVVIYRNLKQTYV